MVGVQIRADPRINAGRAATGAFDLAALAGQPVHVGSRSSEIGNHASETRHVVTNLFDLTEHGSFRATLDDAALVLGDRAEGAAAKAPALYRDRETDHLVGRDRSLAV